MDTDLEALFLQLQQVQEQPATIRLSERMAVDLIEKIKTLGVLEDTLLHTTNGKEYVTTAKLVEEIYECLEDQGGRVAIVDLPGMLGIDFGHCNAQAQVLLQAKPDAVKLVNGDLLSETFFVKMAEIVNDMLLTSAPALGVIELAQHFALPAEQVRACLESYTGSLINGTLEGSTLYTSAFLRLAKGFLRGTLRAALAPVHVSAVLASNPFPHSDAVSNKLAASLVQELLADRAIAGTFKPAGLVFYPSVYEAAQVRAAQTFFAQSRVIEHGMLASWGVSNAKDFLQQHCPGGITLETTYVSRLLVDEIDAAVEAGVPPCGFLDVSEVVSTQLSTDSLNALALMSEAVQTRIQQGYKLLANHFLASPEFLALCNETACGAGQATAEHDLVHSTGTGTSTAMAEPGSTNTGRKAGGKKEGRQKKKGSGGGSHGQNPRGRSGRAQLEEALHVALLHTCFAAADPPCADLLDAVAGCVVNSAEEAYAERLQQGLAKVRAASPQHF